MHASRKLLSLTAAGLYLAVAAACAYAAAAARGDGAPRRGRAIWLTIAGLFVILAASRMLNAEERARDVMRAWLNAGIGYESRRTVQAPIAAAVLGLGGAAGIALLLGYGRARSGSRAERAIVWATRAAAAMIVLVALRLISFHPVDAILYRPLRLNRVFDIGLTAVVGLAALAYVRDGRTQAPGRRGRNG